MPIDNKQTSEENPEPQFYKKELPNKGSGHSVVKKRGKQSGAKKYEEKITKELESIYANEDGSLPDMGDFEFKKRGRLGPALAALLFSCVFLGAVVWVGLFFFNPRGQFSEKDVTLSVSGDNQVVAGEEVTYRFRFRNNQSVPLEKAFLEVRFPAGFVLTETSRALVPGSQDKWDLGTILPQDGDYIDIRGRMYGSISEKQSFRLFLNYQPANFSSLFQNAANFNIEVVDSLAKFSVSAPPEITGGGEVEMIVDIEKPEQDLTNLALVVEPHESFSVKSSEPTKDVDQDQQWSLASLNEAQQIIIKGVFQDNGQTEEQLVFKLVGWKDEKHEGEPFVYAVQTLVFKMIKTDLAVSLAVNGSTKDFSAVPGEVLNSSLVIKNIGQTMAKDIGIRMVFEAPAASEKSLLDWASLTDPFQGDIKGEQLNDSWRRGTISWDKGEIKKLASLAPGEEFTLDLGLPIKDSGDVDLTKFSGYYLTVLSEVSYHNGQETKILLASPLKITVNSDLSFEARDKESKDQQNQETHTVTWLLANSFHELSNIIVEAELYGSVAWQEKDLVVPAGKVEYDSAKKIVRWKIDQWPVSIDVLALQFVIGLTENPSQTNLTSKVKIQAQDTITGETIVLAGKEILLSP